MTLARGLYSRSEKRGEDRGEVHVVLVDSLVMVSPFLGLSTPLPWEMIFFVTPIVDGSVLDCEV